MEKKIDENKEVILNNFETSNPIFITLSLKLVKHGFNFIRRIDLGEVSGSCSECGHPIRYEYWYSDKEDESEYSFGSECNYKLYVLLHWKDQIDIEEIEDKQLQRAGKWLWILYRDHLITLMKEDEKVPQPKDYNKDYKKLADDMKTLVFKVRGRIKKEKKLRDKLEKRREQVINARKSGNEFITKHGININILSDREKEFLKTVYKAEKRGWVLSDPQKKWFNDIKRRSKPDENNGYKEIVHHLLDHISKEGDVNQWESDFITSVCKQVDSGRILSEKQINIIKKLKYRLLNEKNSDIESKIVDVKTIPIKLDTKYKESIINQIKLEKLPDIKIKPKTIEKTMDDINDFNKQDKLDHIEYDTNLTNKYKGKKTKTWIINKTFGLWVKGIIKEVIKKTDKAIICNIELEGVQNNYKQNVLIPITQLEESITL